MSHSEMRFAGIYVVEDAMMFFDAYEQRILFPLFLIMSFAFGACCGSFFNVCIYRIPAGKSLLWPPSHCYCCGSFLKWYDNLPIIGWPLLRGRCRYCATPYSPRYCLVELLTAALFAVAFVVFGPQPLLFFVWIFLGLLIIGTFTDFDHFIIPDRINYGGLLAGLVGAAVVGAKWPAAVALGSLVDDVSFLVYGTNGLPAWWNALPPWAAGIAGAAAGAAAGWVALWMVSVLGRLLFRKEAMGFGDVKLMAFLGAYLGVQGCFQIIAVGSFIGASVSLSAIAWHKLFGKDRVIEFQLDPAKLVGGGTNVGEVMHVTIPIQTAGQMRYLPFGPYLALAAVALLLGHRQVAALIVQWLSIGV